MLDKKTLLQQTEGSLHERAAPERAYLDHLMKINDVFYDQIVTADQKAAYIFTFMLAFMISSSEVREVFTHSRYQTDNYLLIIVSAILAAAMTVTLVASIMVVLPRVSIKQTSSLFWGTWHLKRGPLMEAAMRDDPEYLYRDYLINIDNLSAIARGKYRFVSIGFRSLVIVVLSYFAVLMVGR